MTPKENNLFSIVLIWQTKRLMMQEMKEMMVGIEDYLDL